MTTVISRQELRDMIASSEVQIVDVLPESEFNESHLPGAINIPLKKLTAETVRVLRRDRPTVVY